MSTAGHSVCTPLPISSRIPHAEVWTPTRSMLNHTLPLPSTGEHSLRNLARSERRKETSAMRQVWKNRGNIDRKLPGSVLGQYKQMLGVKDVADGNKNETLQAHHRQATTRSNLIRRRKFPSASVDPKLYLTDQTNPMQKSARFPERSKKFKTDEEPQHVSSYSLDYVQKVGTSSLPKIPVRTLSADWWNEIQKRPMTPMVYSEVLNVEPDKDRIKRELLGKFFMKNSTQTYFQPTVPRLLHTYNIHPEFDSEYVKCW